MGGTPVEDFEAAERARLRRSGAPERDEGAPAPERGTRERDPDVVGHPRTRPRPRRKTTPKPPRTADRRLFAHERPPLEPLPERPDKPNGADSDWRPDAVPKQFTPSVAGFSLSAALLALPITGLRFLLNVGMHAATAITCRVRRVLQQPLPD